jgi:hypothetical protein
VQALSQYPALKSDYLPPRLQSCSLVELVRILEILVEITKDVEPDSRLSLAKQLPLIVQVSGTRALPTGVLVAGLARNSTCFDLNCAEHIEIDSFN